MKNLVSPLSVVVTALVAAIVTIIVNGGWDILSNAGENAEQNFVHLLTPKLNSLNYSCRTMRMIPFSMSDLPPNLSPYDSPYNLRGYRLKIPNRYYLFMPQDSDPNMFRNTAVFFVVDEANIDKSTLYQIFDDPEKVDLFFALVTKCEQGNTYLLRFWEETLEANPDVAPDWDLHKVTRKDQELAAIRQAYAKHFLEVIDEIKSLVEKANEQWGFDLPFDIESDNESCSLAILTLHIRGPR